VVSLADVFDALTHGRCYKKAWEVADVIAYIEDHRGTQFDPELVDIFLEHVDEFKAI
jgi:putative two-component system response regulator